MKQQTNVLEAIVNQMFIIAGHNVSYNDVLNRKDDWYNQWTMTEAQSQEWKEWSVNYLRKKKRWGKTMAEREVAMIDLYCGLKINN